MEPGNTQDKLQRGMIEVNKILRFSESFKIIKKAVESDGMGFVREQCIVDLHKLGDKRVPGVLFNLLDLEGNLGFWVGLAIARLGEKEEILPRLIERLQDPSTVVKENVISALGNLAEKPLDPETQQAYRVNASVSDFSPKDDRIIQSLLPMLDDPEPQVRCRAVLILCHLADPRTTEKLVKALEDPVHSVRLSAANSLGSTGDKRAIPALLKALEKGDEEIDWRVQRSLDFLGYEGEELQPLPGPNSSEAEDFTDEYMDDEERPDGFSARSDRRFKENLAPEGIEGLIEKLVDKKSRDRESAIMSMGFLGDKRAVEPLIDALYDSDFGVRFRSIWALGRIGDTRAFEPLLKLLDDKNSYIRSTACQALVSLPDARAFDKLFALLDDSVDEVRIDAIKAIARLKDSRAFDKMLALTEDDSRQVRYAATVALGSMDDPRAFDLLMVRLKLGDSDTRTGAAAGLGELGDPRAIPALEWARDNDLDIDEGGDGLCVPNMAAEAIGRIRKQIEANETELRG